MRRDFLRVAGAGAAGAVLLGGPSCGSGTEKSKAKETSVEETSVKKTDAKAPNTKRMNVILVILDSLRREHVGAYGNDQMSTPTLDALAMEGLRFSRAHPEAMPTIPARRAIHTGFRTWPTWAPAYGWKPIPEEQPTLAEILKGQGYRTLLITDTYHEFVPPSTNFDRGFDVFRTIRGQAKDRYRDPSSVSEEEMRRRYLIVASGEGARQYLANTQGRKSEEDWFAPRVFGAATELLEEASVGDQPFFLVADSYDPHEPWDPPTEYVSLYDEGYEGKEPIIPRYGEDDYLTERQLLRMRALYSAEVSMVDRWLGEFLERAYGLGVMKNTLLMVISDHGHLLGEHGYTGKLPDALWPELTDTVLLVRHPEGKGAGEESDYYASTHDVAPTVLGSLGIEPPRPMDGQDLLALVEGGDPEPREHFTQGYDTFVCCRDERRVMFCRNDGAGARLYDAPNDPEQRMDLAQEEPETVEKMFEEYVLEDDGGSLPGY